MQLTAHCLPALIFVYQNRQHRQEATRTQQHVTSFGVDFLIYVALTKSQPWVLQLTIMGLQH